MRLRTFGPAAAGAFSAAVLLVNSAAAEQTAIPAGNVVKNPGGEANAGGTRSTENIAPTGWTQSVENPRAKDAVQIVRYGAHGYFRGG